MERKKILIVEDSEVIQLLVQTILEEKDYEFFVSNDGQEALDFLEKQTPDLIILDLMMPVMDGFKFLDELHEPNCPILVLTARSDVESIRRVMASGASDYLVKPFISINLINKIEQLIGK